MNQNLVEINNNCGIVSDENGNVSLIEKKNDIYNFEEILLKENKIENLRLKLDDYRKMLDHNKFNIIAGEITSAVLIAIEIGLVIAFNSVLALEDLIPIIVMSYLPFKVLSLSMYGTRVGRHIKKKNFTAAIEDIESELSTLENELANIKEKSEYKVECSTVDESNDKTFTDEYERYLQLPITINQYYTPKVTNKVRVLKLRKK